MLNYFLMTLFVIALTITRFGIIYFTRELNVWSLIWLCLLFVQFIFMALIALYFWKRTSHAED